MAERKVAHFREEESEATRSLQQFKDDVEVLKNTLNKSATDLVNKRSDLNHLKENLHDRRERLEKSNNHQSELKKKMDMLDDETVSLETRAEQLQEILDKEKLRDKNLDKEIKTLRELQFKLSQALFKLRQEEKNVAAEIVGGEAACRNLKSKINKMDQEALKQRAMLYGMEFNVQQLERKIRRLEGERSDEEKNELLAKIEVQTKKYDEQMNKWNTLNSQLKRSQEDLRQATRQLERLEKSKTELNTNIGELNLYNESATHQLGSKVKEKENLMVEENILRLELRRLRSFVHARSDEVLTLETRKLQLNLALEERSKEIHIHKDMLRVQIKNAEDERHSATTELRDRVGKVEKLKRRYEILMTQFAPEDGEEDHSQAYYVIKAAQKREELQREGDELDANIRRAEKEIKALENTLRLMNDRNEQYRVNLYRAELDGNDLQHKEMLENEYQQVIDSFKKKRATIQDLQLKLQQSERIYASESAKEAEKLQEMQLVEARCDAISRDVDEQAKKRARALQFVRKASKQLRHKAGASGPTAVEQDLLIRTYRDIGTLALKDLQLLGQSFPDIAGKVVGLIELQGLQPPSRSVSRVSSRASIDGISSGPSSGRNSVAAERSAQPSPAHMVVYDPSSSEAQHSTGPAALQFDDFGAKSNTSSARGSRHSLARSETPKRVPSTTTIGGS
ncbi:Coiled-coil domain-containing protein 39 [Kappamyces sp. JEL0680]|nr:Coiled-coil domain-containing protein 39 [Kappamyces sp. JEL0680]